MRTLILSVIFTLQFAYAQQPLEAESISLTYKDAKEVRQNLEAYESGRISLEEVTEKGGSEWARKLVTYYLANTNAVTAKMKLPISRCYAGFGKYVAAAELAKDYVNVHSNDWRGWDILGGAKAVLGDYDEALAAMTNAVRLGGEKNIGTLGVVALNTGRLDILQTMVVPRLLVLKDSDQKPKGERMEMVSILLAYALRADQGDLVVKALQGLTSSDIMASGRLKDLVRKCCEHFKTKEVEAVCSKISENEQSKPQTSDKNKKD